MKFLNTRVFLRTVFLLIAFPSLGLAQSWTLPSSATVGTIASFSFYSGIPVTGNQVAVYAQAPGSTTWNPIGGGFGQGVPVTAPVTYNFPSAGVWQLRAMSVAAPTPAVLGSTPITVNPSPDTQPPTQPGSIMVTSSGTQATVSWGASTDNVGVNIYQVTLFQGGLSGTALTPVLVGGTTWTFDGLTALASYGVSVIAKDFSNNNSTAALAQFVTQPTSQSWILPTDPKVDVLTSFQFVSPGPVSSGSVRIFAQAPGASTWTSVGTGSGTVNTVIAASAAYTFTTVGTWQLKAVNGSAVSDPIISTATLTLSSYGAVDPNRLGFIGMPFVNATNAGITWWFTNDQNIADYEVKLLQGGTSGSVISTVIKAAGDKTHIFSDLIPNTKYGISIIARYVGGATSAALTRVFTAQTNTGGFTSMWDTIAPGVDPGTPASTLGVGVLGGNLSVDNKGMANYSMPLQIPPGRAGLQPSLTVGYSSGSGSGGPMGLGFSLSTGFPGSITRGRSILARDGVTRGITYTSADKFYLDGKRLICTSEPGIPYGAPGSTYRTEVDSFVTVTTAGTGSNIETFTVTDKSGTRMTFGRLGSAWDGYQKGSGPYQSLAYAYALKQVEDVIGNTVAFAYTEVINDAGLRLGEYVISSIRYTGNSSVAGLDKGNITFHYNFTQVAGTTERLDRNFDMITGHAQSRRLDAINVEFDGTRVGYYAFDYSYALNGGPLHLDKIRPYLRNADGSTGFTAVPATNFSWKDDLPTYTTSPGTLATAALGLPDDWTFADVNGDGRDDLVEKGGRVSLSNGTGFDAATSWIDASLKPTYSLRIMKLCDINGDGRKDMIYGSPLANESNKLYALVSTGSKFVPLGGGTTPTEIFSFTDEFKDPPPNAAGSNMLVFQTTEEDSVKSRITVGDFTGDGRDDILIHRYNGKLKLLKSNGTSFTVQPEYDVGARSLFGHISFEGALTPLGFAFFGVFVFNDIFSVSMMPCELNGDGITDYAWLETDNNWGIYTYELNGEILASSTHYAGQRQVWAVLSLPGGGFSPKTGVGGFGWINSSTGKTPHRENIFMILPGDVNGDGLTDFLVMHPGNMIAANNDQGQAYPGSQRVLHHSLMISLGGSTQPSFKSVNPPFPLATPNIFDQAANPYVLINDQAVRPWFDSISIGNWINDYYNELRPSVSMLFASGITSESGNMYLSDLNGDGREDYVWYNNKGTNVGWLVAYSLGESFATPVMAPVSWYPSEQIPPGTMSTTQYIVSSRTPLELNGDGIPDYAYDVHFTQYHQGISGFYISQGQPGARLKKVTDGLGRQTDIAYKPITDNSVYTPGTVDNPTTPLIVEEVTYPIRDLRNSQYVVSDVWHDSGSTTPAQFSYQYSGNRLDLSGRGSLGFHSFVTIDRQTGLFKYQFLAQSFPMTGLTMREETYRWWNDGQDRFRYISSHDNTVVFDKVATGGGATLWPFISKAIEYRWEDALTAHFSFSSAASNSQSENLFSAINRNDVVGTAHIKVSAESRFDSVSSTQVTLPGVSGYNPSDVSGTMNTVSGTLNGNPTLAGSTFYGLPGNITHGNLTYLKTDYGDGFTETVETEYKNGVTLNNVITLTGLPITVKTTVTSDVPGALSEVAPIKRITYELNTALVKTEMIDAGAGGVTNANSNLNLTTTYTRDPSDPRGRVTETSITSPDPAIGTYIVSSVPSPGTNFDDKWDLPKVTQNNYGHATSVEYHPFLAKPITVKGPNYVAGANGVRDEVTTVYDALARPVKVRNELTGIETTSTFVSDTTLPPVEGPSVGADLFNGVASGWETQPQPKPIVGVALASAYRVDTSTTVAPSTTTYYDRLGRVIRTIKDGFQGQQTVTDAAYNNLGQTVATSLPYLAGGSRLWTKNFYDRLGRVKEVVAPNGTKTTNAYAGRTTTVTVTPLDGIAQSNATQVDAKGRTVKVWNANPDTGTVSSTVSIEFRIDGFGRMRETWLEGTNGSVTNKKITATYDALGRQTSLTDPDKGAWDYLNNALGQVVWQKDANDSVTTSTFDKLGRPLTRTTKEKGTGTVAAPNGPIETAGFYYYDSAANAALHLVAKGTKGWIGAPEREEADTTGAPGFDTPKTINLHYYDEKGRPSVEMARTDDKWFYTYSDYDAYSRIRQVRHHWKPSGAELPTQQPYVWQDFGYTYTYDGTGAASKSYLIALTDSLGRSWWDNPVYDYMDRVTTVRKGAGYTTIRSYRPTDGVLTGLASSNGVATVQNMTFGFDGLGNLTSRADTGVSGYSNVSETLTYDSLNRLKISKQGTTNYAANGNITSKPDVKGITVSGYIYDSNKPHAVASVSFNGQAVNYAYDANGNLTSRQNAAANDNTYVAWAGFDKPRWLTRNKSGVITGSEFHYNANRSRVLQLEFDSTSGANSSQVPLHYNRKRTYALGSTLELNYDNLGSGSTQDWSLKKVRIYVPGPDGIIGTREFDVISGTNGTEKALVYHYDHLGSITATTLHGQTTVALDGNNKPGKFSEDAWGQRRDPVDWIGAADPAVTDDGSANSVTPRGYTGHEMLDDLGLVHMNGRIYDPLLGRFLSADILVQNPGDLQAYNRYSYVFNNPLRYVDPSGFKTISDYEDVIKKQTEEKQAELRAAYKANGFWGALGYAMGRTSRLHSQRINEAQVAIEEINTLASDLKEYAGVKTDARKMDDSTPEYRAASGGMTFVKMASLAIGGKSGAQIVAGEYKGAAKSAAIDAAVLLFLSKLSALIRGEGNEGTKIVANVTEDAAERAAAQNVAANDIKVIGRLPDTEVAKQWPGHDVLNIQKWTPAKNAQWVDEGIKNGQVFYTGSPEAGNLIHTSGRFAGQPTIYAQEIQQLKAAGYVKVGDYYVPPSQAATFKP